MKKLLATLAILAAVSVTSQAAPADGGTVSLNNYDSNNPIFYNNAATRLPVANSFVQVLGGPVGGSLTVISGANPISMAEPGFFDGGFAAIAGTTPGGQASLQVRAWRGAGTTFASSSEKGNTPVFNQATGTNPDLPSVPAPAALNMPSFTVGVPEPSTIVLGVLGAGLLLFRRRK